MAGFTDYDAIINALTVSLYGQRLDFLKTASFTTAAPSWWTTWNTAGLPAQGTYSGTTANAQQVTSATTGAISYTNPTSPRKMWLLGGEAAVSNVVGTLYLWDRLLYYPGINHNTSTTQALTNGVTIPRYTSGDKVYAWLEVTSGLGATAQTCTLTYTDQLGNTGNSTGAQTIVASSAVSRLPHQFPYFPLAAGDTGIQKVDSYIFSAANTGTSALVLGKLLAAIPIGVAAVSNALDLVRGPQLTIPQLQDNAALCLTFAANTAASSPVFSGSFQICEQ